MLASLMATSSLLPVASLIVREHGGEPFYEAKFRYCGRQVKRRIGPAWLIFDRTSGEWRPRRGRVPDGAFDERRAHVAAAELVQRIVGEWDDAERIAAEARSRGSPSGKLRMPTSIGSSMSAARSHRR